MGSVMISIATLQKGIGDNGLSGTNAIIEAATSPSLAHAYHYTTTKVPLNAVLTPEILSLKPPLTATTLTPTDSSNTATLLSNTLHLSITPATFPALGLTACKRNRSRFTPVSVAPVPSVRARAIWALSEERAGGVNLALTRLHAPLNVPNLPTSHSHVPKRQSRQFRACVPDADTVLRGNGNLEELIDMVQRLAGVETDEGLVLEDDGIEKEVRTVSYVGLAEGMAVEAVDVVRASVRDGAAWGVVVARAADTPAVWEGEGPRGGGSIGFGGDAAEVFIVVPDAVVVVQLRGVLDMA